MIGLGPVALIVSKVEAKPVKNPETGLVFFDDKTHDNNYYKYEVDISARPTQRDIETYHEYPVRQSMEHHLQGKHVIARSRLEVEQDDKLTVTVVIVTKK